LTDEQIDTAIKAYREYEAQKKRTEKPKLSLEERIR
jgi:hypothetical protein